MSNKQSLVTKSRSPFFTLNILHVLNDGMLASLPLLLPFIQKDLNIEFGKIGILTSIIGIASVVLALPSTLIARKYGGTKVLFVAVFIYSLAFALTCISTNFLFLGISFIIASIGFGVFHPISFASIAQMSTTQETGSRMGNFTAVGDIGRVGISAFVTVLVSIISWRNTAFVYAVFSIGVAVLLLVHNRNRGEPFQASSSPHEVVHGLHGTIDFINAVITGFIDGLASSSIFVFIPFLFIFRGASTAVIGSMTGAFFIGNMIGKVSLGRISDKLGSKKVFFVSEILMAVLLLLMATVANMYALIGISIVLGAVTKGTVPIINTIVASVVPDKRLYEKAFGISSLTTGIAAAISSVAYGFIAEKYSIQAVFHVSALFALCAPFPITLRHLYLTFKPDRTRQ